MYRSTPIDNQFTHLHPATPTVKPPPLHDRRPNELPPELPQVSKEWLASPQNLLIHSTYTSHTPTPTPAPTRTRTRTRTCNRTTPSPQRRWSSFLPIPTPTSTHTPTPTPTPTPTTNGLSSQETPPQYRSVLAPPPRPSCNAPLHPFIHPSPTARARRRSAGWPELLPPPRPRPYSLTFAPSPSPDPDPSCSPSASRSPPPVPAAELLTCLPNTSSFVMVFPSDHPDPPDGPQQHHRPLSPKKHTFFRSVSHRLRALFHHHHPSPPTRDLPHFHHSLPNIRCKRHSALVTRREFLQHLPPRPASVIVGGPWNRAPRVGHPHHHEHAHDDGHHALYSPVTRTRRDSDTLRGEGDTPLIEEEEDQEQEQEQDEGEDGDEQEAAERMRQINRSRALQSLENFQFASGPRSYRGDADGRGPAASPCAAIPCGADETAHSVLPDDSPVSPRDASIFPPRTRKALHRASAVGRGLPSVVFSLHQARLDLPDDSERDRPLAGGGDQHSLGFLKAYRTDLVDIHHTLAQHTADPDLMVREIYPRNISNHRPPPAGSGSPVSSSHHSFPLVPSADPRWSSRSSGDSLPQHSVMPILSHTRASNFPFRRRRASSSSSSSSSSSARDSPLIDPVNTTSSSATTTSSATRITNSLSASHSTSCSNSNSHPSSPCDQSNSDQSSSRILRPFRHRSTHFEKFQAKMATVKLRSSTLNPTSSRIFSSGFSNFTPSSNHVHNPPLHPSARRSNPTDIRLSWETSRTTFLTDMPLDGSRCPSPDSHIQPFVSPSCVSMIDHSSDSSSHLTLTSEPCSNKLSNSSPRVANLPPQIELSLSFHSSKIEGLPYSASSPASPTLPPLPTRPPCEGGLRTAKLVSQVIDQPNVRSIACPLPPPQQASNPNQANGALPVHHGDDCVSSLISRVRPTPSPRLNSSLNHNVAASTSSLVPTVRPSGVPARLAHLVRLNSYSVPLSEDREPSESSSENDHIDSVEDEVGDDYQEGSVQSEGTSDDEDVDSSHHHGDRPAVPNSVPPPSFLLQTQTVPHEWIARGMDTPSAPKPTNIAVQLPSPRSVPRPEANDPSTAIVSSPGHRARLLLLSPAALPSPAISSLLPRTSNDSRRSQSAVDLSLVGSDAPSAGSANPGVNNENMYQSSLFGSLVPCDQLLPVIPHVIVDSTHAPSAFVPVEPLAVPRTDPATAAPRHQSMYEFRPSNYLPSYDSHQPLSTSMTISPREDEGRERLPLYSCAIHLEGWMLRKMEFKSPGVQAKDRSWKRQYVILHGTMIRIYRSDPRTHPLAGSNDPYSSHFIHSRSSSLLASTCGIDTRRPFEAPPLHFHVGKHDSVPVNSLKETAIVKAVHQNSLQRVYTLQNAESGLAADYVKRKYVVRVRAEGEQFLLQAKNDRGVIDLIEALQAATNVSLDLDVRPLPKFITLPRRRRRRRAAAPDGDAARTEGAGRRDLGTAIVETMVAEAQATRSSGSRRREPARADPTGDRMEEMLAEEQEAYLQGRS